MNLKRVLTIATHLVMLAGVAFSGSAHAVPTVDGIRSAGEYTNSFQAGWYNDHNEDHSNYKEAYNLMTTVFWEKDANNFWLYMAAPIEAKNLVWGTGVTPAEGLLYFQHACSPTSGTAALDGSNCTHHKESFAEFMSGRTGYATMTKSEKLMIGSFVADFAEGTVSGPLNGHSVLAYKDSEDYVKASLGCDTTNCDASGTPMAFEFKFGSLSDTQISNLIGHIQSNKMVFHLSDERQGVTPIPEPETYAMLLAGLGVLGFVARRRKQKLAA